MVIASKKTEVGIMQTESPEIDGVDHPMDEEDEKTKNRDKDWSLERYEDAWPLWNPHAKTH